MAAAAVPLIVAAAGTAAAYRGQQVQASKQRDFINQALTRTSKSQADTNTAAIKEASTMAAPERALAFQQQADATNAQQKADLAASGATSGDNAVINTAGDSGNVSGDFLKLKADRALTEGSRLSAIARQLAQVRAPGQVQTNEAQRRANLSEQIGSEWSDTKAANNASTLDAQNVQLPGYAKLGKLAQMAALAYLSGGAGAGAAGAAGGASAGAAGAAGAGTAGAGVVSNLNYWG